MPNHFERLNQLMIDTGLTLEDEASIRFLRPDHIEITIRTLFESGLFTSPILLMVFHHRDPLHFATLLASLKDNGRLTETELNGLLGHSDPYSLALGLAILDDYDLYTPDHLNAIIDHPTPEDLAWSFYHLSQCGLLSSANWSSLCASRHPARLTVGLYYLETNHILNDPNRQHLLECIDDPCFIELLETLSRNDLLDQANFDSIMRTTNLSELLDALKLLARTSHLNQHHFNDLVNHAKPKELAIAIGSLGRSSLLSEHNYQTLIHHRNFHALVFPLHVLEWVGILNQETFDALLDERHQVLLNVEFRDSIWDQLPERELRIHLPEILATASGVNPIHRLRRLVHRLMTPYHPDGEFNPPQATHTASIHRTVSSSALKLFERYGNKDVDESLNTLRLRIMALEDTLTNRAAQSAFLRLTQQRHVFIDPTSSLSTLELLAYAFEAVQDEDQLLCTKEEAFGHLITGLYEIQRGYNLSETEVDNGLVDSPICSSGSFNKLVEKLWGIHKDVEVRYLTAQGASLKFRRLALHEAERHLERAYRPKTPEEYSALSSLIESLKTDGLQPIWPAIQETVSCQLMEAFGDLYDHNPTHPDFLSLLETITYINFEDKAGDNLLRQAALHLERENTIAYHAGFFHERTAALSPLAIEEETPAVFSSPK